jgi:multidrug efflux pump subunit AcrA (membrane-fusion protein)
VQTHARFKLQLVEADYARQQELYEEGSLSAVELQQLDLQVLQARMQLAAANAAVDVATANLAFANIVAPADGQITAVPLVGQRVNINAGLPVLIKMNLD